MGFVVKRYGFVGSKRGHRLTFIDQESLSAYQEFDLPFDDSESVWFGVSCGLFYFMGMNGQIFLCNLGSKQMKELPKLEFKSHPHEGCLRNCCLGYDAASQDYMVISLCVQYYRDVDDEGECTYAGAEASFRLYSLKHDSWEVLLTPVTYILNERIGVYLAKTGCCYWTAYGGDEDPKKNKNVVVSFDFAIRNFSQFDLPHLENKEDDDAAISRIVDRHGSLAAIRYYKSRHHPSVVTVKIYIRKATSWKLSHAVRFDGVNNPINLINGRLLALEAKHTSQSGQLMLYDLKRGKLKKLDIYDHKSHMMFHSCNPSCEVELRGSKSITLIPYDESTDQPPVPSEEDERLEEARKLALRREEFIKPGKRKRKSKTAGKRKIF